MDDPSSDPINQFFDADELERPYILYLTLSLLPHAGSSSRSSTAIDGVTSDAVEGITQDDIKKAYRRAALKCHPDKHSHKQEDEKQQMSKEFQKVGFAYAVLSDETRKKRYDETGRTDESFFSDGAPAEGGWEAYFEAIFKRVDKKILDEDKARYQGSDEEKQDLHAAYLSTKGSLPTILDQIPHSTTADEARFIEIVNAAVASGELPKFQEWNKTTVKEYTAGRKKRVAKEKKEAIEAEQAARDLGVWEEFYGAGAQARKKAKDSRDGEAEEVGVESAEQRKVNGQKRKKRKPAGAVDENDADEDTSTLAALIQSRQKARSSVMDALFDKYSKMSNEDDEEIDMASRGGKRQKKGKVDGSTSKNQTTDGSVDDIPALDDAEFEAFQSKLFAGKASSSNGKPSRPKRKGKKI